MSLFLRFLFCALALVQLSSCKLLDGLENMQDDTKELKRLTSEMADKTEELKKLSEESQKDLRDTSEDQRQGVAQEMRMKYLSQMEAGKSMDEKVVSAGEYYIGLEYQLLTTENSTPEMLDAKLEEAMTEFLIQTIPTYIKDLKPKDPTSLENDDKNFYALSYTLHRRQFKDQFRTPIESRSMYDLLVDVLKAGDRAPYGEMKEYEKLVWEHYERIALLLETRANFCATAAVAKMAGIETVEGSIYKYEKDAPLDQVINFLGRLVKLDNKLEAKKRLENVDLSRFNKVQLARILEFMSFSEKTYQDYELIFKEKPIVSKSIKEMYKYLKVRPDRWNSMNGEETKFAKGILNRIDDMKLRFARD